MDVLQLLRTKMVFDAEGSTRWESMSFDNCYLPMQRVEVLICPPLLIVEKYDLAPGILTQSHVLSTNTLGSGSGGVNLTHS